jgi:pyrroloquinoline quinone biosynthesis protein B
MAFKVDTKVSMRIIEMGIAVTLFSLVGLGAMAQQSAAEGPPFVMLLGTAQDGGYPQSGCTKDCCKLVAAHPERERYVASLAIIDPVSRQRWIIDATPHFPKQLAMVQSAIRHPKSQALSGVFLTHAHVGHYAGLIHLGREVMGTRRVPVYAMPRMRAFLEKNGPWEQLVKLKNIEIRPLKGGQTIILNKRLKVTPILVPHRDEYSETVAYLVAGPARSVLWLPDIDKWHRFKLRIEALITTVDRAYLDGTFYAANELPGRNMADIPHPFIVESMERFSKLPALQRGKIHFIHLNHTNPALQLRSDAYQKIQSRGFNLGKQGERFSL